MDFKSLLNSLDQLSEATKEKEGGRVHTADPGGYGRKDDEDEEGNKVKQSTEKRGRGRPKKVDAASGEDKSYDFSAFGVKKGKDVKLPKYDKSKTTKHTLKDWIEQIDRATVNESLSESEQVQIMPAQSNTHVIKQGSKTLGTVTNPQLAQQIKQSIGKGEMSIAGDELGEEAEYSAKKARAGKDIGKPGKQFSKIAKSAAERYGSKESGEKAAGEVLAKLRAKKSMGEALMPTDDSTAGAGLGAGRSQTTLEGRAKADNKAEKAGPKGVLPEQGMAEDQLDEIGDTPAGKAALTAVQNRAYDTMDAWSKNSASGFSATPKQVKRATGAATAAGNRLHGFGPDRMKQDTVMARDALRKQLSVAEGAKPDFLDLDKDGNKKESMKKAASDKKKVKEGADHRLKSARHMGKSHALAKEGYNCRYDDVEEARAYHDGFKEGLDECYNVLPMRGVVGEEMPVSTATMAKAADPIIDEMDMEEGNAFTGALAREKAAMSAHRPEGDGKFKVGNKEFKVTAEASPFDMNEDIQIKDWNSSLESLLNESINEGLSISSSTGQQGMPDSVSVTATDMDAEKVMSLIKQLGVGAFGDQSSSGHDAPDMHSGAGQHGGVEVVDDHDGMMALMKKVSGHHDHGQEYENEEGHDSEEETCNECGGMMEEGHSCNSKEMVDETETEDQMTYEVAEDEEVVNNNDEAEEEETDSQRDAALAKAAGANFAKVDEDEAEAEAEDAGIELDETYANSADDDFTAQTEFMTNTITSGLNKKKSTGQTTIPVIAGQTDRMGYNVKESILDWKTLAGIK